MNWYPVVVLVLAIATIKCSAQMHRKSAQEIGANSEDKQISSFDNNFLTTDTYTRNDEKDATKEKIGSHSIKFCNPSRYLQSSNGICSLESKINEQINMELRAFYEYLYLGYYFAHEDYNLPHFSKYFLENSKEELKHAQDLMQYQMTRGAKLDLAVVAAPKNKQFNSSCEAVNHARSLELSVTKQIERIWREADTYQDVHLMDHLETHFVTEQHESLKKLADIEGSLNRMGVCKGSRLVSCDKLAEFQFDQTVMKNFVKS